jgi:hypothetical protein
MYDDATLLPPASLIHERLTFNARERHRLRTLLRLVRHAAKERDRKIDEPRSEAVGRGGVMS